MSKSFPLCPKCGHSHGKFGDAWNYKTGQVYLKNECLNCHYIWFWKYPILDEHGNETGKTLKIKTVEEWVAFENNPEYTIEKVNKQIRLEGAMT
jgi:hypothetical protein